MKNKEKLFLYDLLMTNYSVGEQVAMSAVGNFLRTHEIEPKDYGFEKLLGLFQSLSELCTLEHYQPHPNAPTLWNVTFLPRPDLAVEDEPEDAAEGSDADETVRPTLPDELPEALDEETLFFHFDIQNSLAKYVTGIESRLSTDVLEQIRKDYLAEKAAGRIVFDEAHNCYSFAISTKAANGSALMLSIRKNERETGNPWLVSFAGYDNKKSSAPKKLPNPRNALRSFAHLGDETEFLRSLAEHVQKEPWNFSGKEDDYYILNKYITYTFHCAQQQDKVRYASDGSFAVFNTGLQSRALGEDVYAYFVPNGSGAESPFKFYRFCSSDSGDPVERRCYDMMFEAFKEPEPPRYFKVISDLLFDPACEVKVSSDHIFKDNCDRLPHEFLRKEFRYHGNREAEDLLDRIEAAPAYEKKELYECLGKLIVSDRKLFPSMNGKLEIGIKDTLKRVRRNYKLAVPSFFPTYGIMSMMLPISLDGEDRPNLVLACKRTPNGVYLGKTILTLSMAYINARLICQPGSEWLNTDCIKPGTEETEE